MNNLNRMTASPKLTYTNDVLGNRTSKTPAGTSATTVYDWDDVNQLVGTQTTATSNGQYKYRADGMRVSKLKVTGNFLGARGIEAIFTSTSTSDTATYPLYDAHGNMTSTIAKSGSSFVSSNPRTYDVWGGIRSGAQTAGPNNRSCAALGHVREDGSGPVYMRARYFEPGTGRFISEDPACQGANWAIYDGNVATVAADFSGKFAWVFVGAVLGGIEAWILAAFRHEEWMKLTISICVGVIAGRLAALLGIGLSRLLSGAGVVMAGGAIGGARSAAINDIVLQMQAQGNVNWGRVARIAGICGIRGLAFGAIGACPQQNTEITATISGVDRDLVVGTADNLGFGGV